MDPDDREILHFVENLFEECLSKNFQVTYVSFRQGASNAPKHISDNAVAAINDVVKCFLEKFTAHIKDIIRILRRCDQRDVFFTRLGEFYLLESEFSWSKMRKFLGIACAVATSCYIENRRYITTDILVNIVSFLGSKRFGNPGKFVQCQPFEQNSEDYVSKNVYERIVGDIKHLNDLKKELPDMLQEFTKTSTAMSIINSEQSDAASSSQATSGPSDSSFQLQSCVSINSSSPHASNQVTQFTVRNDSSEQTTVNMNETVAAKLSGAESYHIPLQYCINNPVSSGIADNMTYNEAQSILNYSNPSEAEAAEREQLIFSEVSELEYLIKLSLKTIYLIKKNSKTVSSMENN